MGYFSNGTEGELYESRFCDRCANQDGCTVWLLHLMHNYDEYDKPESMLHIFIPREKDGRNGQCTMFREKSK